MAGFGDTFENDVCKLIFNATAITNLADNAASSALTNLWVGLHTGDPTDTGDQGTNEVALTGYTRTAVARTSTGWTVSANSVSPAANIDFPQITSTATATVTHASIGFTSATTGGKIIASGAVSPNISLSQNVTPRLTTASAFTLD